MLGQQRSRKVTAASAGEQRQGWRRALEPCAGENVAAQPIVDEVGASTQIVDEWQHLHVTIGTEAGHHVLAPLGLDATPGEGQNDAGHAGSRCHCRRDARILVRLRWVVVNRHGLSRPAPFREELEQEEARVASAAQRHDRALMFGGKPAAKCLTKQRHVAVDRALRRERLRGRRRDRARDVEHASPPRQQPMPRQRANPPERCIGSEEITQTEEHRHRAVVERRRNAQLKQTREPGRDHNAIACGGVEQRLKSPRIVANRERVTIPGPFGEDVRLLRRTWPGMGHARRRLAEHVIACTVARDSHEAVDVGPGFRRRNIVDEAWRHRSRQDDAKTRWSATSCQAGGVRS